MPRRTRDSGFTLIEMVIVISLLAILMAAGIRLLGMLLRVERNISVETRVQISLSRVSQRWREDLHAATEVTERAVPQAPQEILLRLPTEEVLWKSRPGGVIRERLHKGSSVGRDAFLFAPQATCLLDYQPDQQLALLTVSNPWPAGLHVETTRPAVHGRFSPLIIQASRSGSMTPPSR